MSIGDNRPQQQNQQQHERRKPSINVHDIQAIAHALLAMNIGGMSAKDHDGAHDAIKVFIERENRNRENSEAMWKKISVTAITATFTTVVTGVGIVVWQGVKAIVHTM